MAQKNETATAAEEPARLFRLNVGQPNPASAVLQFTWCLTQEATEMLKRNQVKHPFILISVYKMGYPEEDDRRCIHRYKCGLLALDKPFWQLQFTRPGDFAIFASIIWNNNMGKEWYSHYRKLHRRYAAEYPQVHLDDNYGYANHRFNEEESLNHHERVDVTIDKRFFGERPQGWFGRFVELWHKPAVDSCQFKRRAIWAPVWKPAVILLYIVFTVLFRLLCGVLFVMQGRRDINFKPILHPFSHSISNMCNDDYKRGNYYWLTNEEGKPRSFLSGFLRAPFGWFICVMAGFALYQYDVFSWLNLNNVLALIIILFSFPLLGVLSFLVYKLFFSKAPGEAEQAQKAKREEEKRRILEEFRLFYDTRIDPLVCNRGGPQAGNLNAVPPTHRTFWMKVMDHKARTCRPYQK